MAKQILALLFFVPGLLVTLGAAIPVPESTSVPQERDLGERCFDSACGCDDLPCGDFDVCDFPCKGFGGACGFGCYGFGAYGFPYRGFGACGYGFGCNGCSGLNALAKRDLTSIHDKRGAYGAWGGGYGYPCGGYGFGYPGLADCGTCGPYVVDSSTACNKANQACDHVAYENCKHVACNVCKDCDQAYCANNDHCCDASKCANFNVVN